MAVIGGVPVAPAQSENVCARTVQVGNAIQAASGGDSCARLTLHHLRRDLATWLKEVAAQISQAL